MPALEPSEVTQKFGRQGLLALCLLMAACANQTGSLSPEPAIITVANRDATDVCGLYVWSESDLTRRGDNRLLPGTVLVGRDSPYRLAAGSWRDVVVPNDSLAYLEARDCEGKIVASWSKAKLPLRGRVFQIAAR